MPSQFEVFFDPPLSQAGLWRMEVDGVGCSVEIPLDRNNYRCEGTAFFLWEEEWITGLALEDTPDEATIRVVLDGAEQFSETRVVDWAESEPNGEGCGTRRLGQEWVAL